jgi:hypothetical protein
MRAHHLIQWTAAVGVAAIFATVVTPAIAAPVPSSVASVKSALMSDVSEVRWRGRGGGGAGIAAGVLGGLLLGGIIASQPNYYGGPAYYGPPGYYYGPGYAGPPDWVAYCFSRYRSFDPVSGTYMGYDGVRHACQ